MFAVVLGLSVDGLSIVSHAESQGRVKVNSAKIRSEASTSSNHVASVVKDNTLTIVSQVQGEDNYVWYEVWINANATGYIRSDLVELIDGSTPNTGTTATPVPEQPVDVTEVNPISATVNNGTSVRVRSNASTTSNIVATVSNGLAVTITGQATGTDGKVWYLVNYISGNSQINGFIRYDFLSLSGEVTPVTPLQPEVTREPEQPVETSVPSPEQKAYDTIWQDGKWMVYDTSTNSGWEIDKLLSSANTNGKLYDESQKTVKNQKIVIIILVVLLVGAGTGVAYLIFKLKDTMDSAYFNQVESETLRRRSAAASQGSGQRVMHTVGTERQSSRPAGAQVQRPAGAQGQKSGGSAQGQRPAGTSQGQKPAGSAQGQRPAGTAQGQRPAGTVQGQRPAGSAQGQRPEGTAQGQKPTASRQSAPSKPQPKGSQQDQGWQSKNFMSEDDEEFEFEFLNMDGKDGK